MAVLCGILALVGVVSVFSLCKAASRADKRIEGIEKIFTEKEKM